METLRNTDLRLESALKLHAQGLRLVPLFGKRPALRDWLHLQLADTDIREWNRRGVNWGIVTGEPLVVLDSDTERAEAWMKKRRIESPVMVQSGRGGLHRYFVAPPNVEVHNRQGLHGIHGLDVRGWHGFIVAAGSRHPETGRLYEYLLGKEMSHLHELPPCDPAWFVSHKPSPPRSVSRDKLRSGTTARIRDLRRYIRGIPSVQGQGGSNACYRVACLLVDAGYDFEQALRELLAWSEACAFPPWSYAELIHKLTDACKRDPNHD